MGRIEWNGLARCAVLYCRRWHVMFAAEQPVRTIVSPSLVVEAVVVSPDGRFLYSASENVTQWDVSSGTVRAVSSG